MTILDCESLEAALNSLSNIYGADRERIERFLTDRNMVNEFECYQDEESRVNYLKRIFENEFGGVRAEVSDVAWFHLTRAPAGSDFAEGVLPLNLALDRIWNTIFSVANSDIERERLNDMRLNGVSSSMYRQKIRNPQDWGPFAMLVREAAFNSSRINNRNFLDCPEIIHDICAGYRDKYNECIYGRVVSSLHKCIVKFRFATDVQAHLIGIALLYCWERINNEEFTMDASTCLNVGRTIDPESIVAVEFIE